MSENNKNGNDQLPDFLRYRQNKMTDRERNAFERSLQKDPFADEASEGFKEIDPDLAEKDVSELSKSLKKRTGKKQRVIWYRIAASVAVLMVLSAIFIITDKRKEPGQIAYSPVEQKKEEIEILKEEPVTENLEYAALPAEEEQKAAIDQKRISQPPARAAADVVEIDKKTETREEKVSVEQQEAVMAADEVRPAMADAAKKAVPSKSVRTIKTSDTITEFTPDTSEFNLNEVVVVGYGTRDAADEAVNEYTPPLPATGRSAFDKYIRDNIRRPDTTTSGQRVVVVLNFNVNPNGIIDSIKVVRSPGKIFSDEAIRLIIEGPAWKPAEENGTAITDEVRVRIVFK
jgi:TonB family protein